MWQTHRERRGDYAPSATPPGEEVTRFRIRGISHPPQAPRGCSRRRGMIPRLRVGGVGVRVASTTRRSCLRGAWGPRVGYLRRDRTGCYGRRSSSGPLVRPRRCRSSPSCRRRAQGSHQRSRHRRGPRPNTARVGDRERTRGRYSPQPRCSQSTQYAATRTRPSRSIAPPMKKPRFDRGSCSSLRLSVSSELRLFSEPSAGPSTARSPTAGHPFFFSNSFMNWARASAPLVGNAL